MTDSSSFPRRQKSSLTIAECHIEDSINTVSINDRPISYTCTGEIGQNVCLVQIEIDGKMFVDRTSSSARTFGRISCTEISDDFVLIEDIISSGLSFPYKPNMSNRYFNIMKDFISSKFIPVRHLYRPFHTASQKIPLIGTVNVSTVSEDESQNEDSDAIEYLHTRINDINKSVIDISKKSVEIKEKLNEIDRFLDATDPEKLVTTKKSKLDLKGEENA